MSLSPSLTAVKPTTFEGEGTSYNPLKDEISNAIGPIEALGDSEEDGAEISGSFDDLLLGPQNDGPFLEPVGGRGR